jgi:hypothetical protein
MNGGWKRVFRSQAARALLLCASAALGGSPRGVFAQEARLRVVEGPGRFVVEYGPLDLKPRGYRDAMREPPATAFVVPADGWLRGYSIELTDAAGRRLPQRMLHHLNLMMTGRRDLFNHGMLRIGAAGPETAPVGLPRIIGVPAHRGDTVLMTFMLYNPTLQSHAGVTLRVIVPFTPATSLIGAAAVYPFSVAIGPAGQPNLFDLPPGRSEHVWEGSPSVRGRLLGLSGHMHRYGTALRLEDRTTGTTLWTVKPEPGSGGEVVPVPRTHLLWPAGVPLRPDHVYRVTAVYDNPTGAVIPHGGMGVVGGIMTLGSGERWPAVDVRHPQYLADVRSILSPPIAHMAHGYEKSAMRHAPGAASATANIPTQSTSSGQP